MRRENNSFIIWGLLLTFCLLIVMSGKPGKAAEAVRYRALLVTRGDYTGTVLDLTPGPENDGKNVERMLENAYGREALSVTVKSDIYKKETLKAEIQEAFADAGAEDINYFYYSGHGETEGLNLERGAAPVTAEDLLDCFEGIEGTNVLIIDCCYAGKFTGEAALSRSVEKQADTPEGFAEQFVQGFQEALEAQRKTRTVLNNRRFRLLLGASEEELSNQTEVGIFTASVVCGAGIDAFRVDTEEYYMGESPANFNQDAEITYNEICRFIQNHCVSSHVRMYPSDNEECFLPDQNGGGTVTFERANVSYGADGKCDVEISYHAAKETTLDLAYYFSKESWGIQNLFLKATMPDRFPVFYDDGEEEYISKRAEQKGILLPAGYGTFTFSLPVKNESMEQGFYGCLLRPLGSSFMYLMPFVYVQEEWSVLGEMKLEAQDTYHPYGCEEWCIRADFGDRSSEPDAQAEVSCVILDENNEVVRELGMNEPVQVIQDGTTEQFLCYRNFYWDGKDAAGNYVPGGIYTARVSASDGAGSRTLEKAVTVVYNAANLQVQPGRAAVNTNTEISVTFDGTALAGGTAYFQKGEDISTRIELGVSDSSETGGEIRADVVFSQSGWYDLYMIPQGGNEGDKEFLVNALKVYEEQEAAEPVISAEMLDLDNSGKITCSYRINNEDTAVTVRVLQRNEQGEDIVVRTLLEQKKTSSGVWLVSWNGKTEDGSAAISGNYYFEITAEEAPENRAVTASSLFEVKGQKNTDAVLPPDSDAGQKEQPSVRQEPEKVPVTSVSARVGDRKVTRLVIGRREKVTLSGNVLPGNASDKTVKYTSSKKSVVSVSAAGVIRGVKTGKATVTLTASNGKKCSVKVIVRKAPKKIKLNAAAKVLKKGKSFRIKVKLPSKTASYKRIFTSSNKKVASVNSKGKVTAKKKGSAVITVKLYNGKKAKLRVTVR